jgi:hypothetical protein
MAQLLGYGLTVRGFSFDRLDTCIVNALLLHGCNLFAHEMIHLARRENFLRQLLGPRRLVASAIKMRGRRILNMFAKIHLELGTPFTGTLFLPYVTHGHGRYCLGGNWWLVHVRSEDSA